MFCVDDVQNLVSKKRFTSREEAMAASIEKAIRQKAAASEADYGLREKYSRKKNTKQVSPTGRLYFKSNFFFNLDLPFKNENTTGCPKKVQKFEIKNFCPKIRSISKVAVICQTSPQLKFWYLVCQNRTKMDRVMTFWRLNNETSRNQSTEVLIIWLKR